MRVVQGGFRHGSGAKKKQITDHRYQNLIFLNHENKQVMYIVCFQKISVLPPQKGLEIPGRRRGLEEPKI